MITVTSEDFADDSMRIFGYPCSHEKMKGLRDLFCHTQTLYAYRLNGGGVKASNDYAEALYGGIRGNDLKIIIQKNVDDEKMLDVKTMLDMSVVDEQTVSEAAGLKDNAYVKFKKDAVLQVTASMPLEGGTNGEVSGAAHQDYLDKIESCRRVLKS